MPSKEWAPGGEQCGESRNKEEGRKDRERKRNEREGGMMEQGWDGLG